jgi:hypothetical protein
MINHPKPTTSDCLVARETDGAVDVIPSHLLEALLGCGCVGEVKEDEQNKLSR